jgi:pyruvate/2-oxoacid:ferredoxin oxidoreductase alpha subunit
MGDGMATKREIRMLTGNEAAAQAVRLCRPSVIAAYPITPQSELVEELAKFAAEGLIDAEMVEVEGEHSAMSVLIGASAAGARTFTATSGQGLAYMYEPYFAASTQRLPIVMAIANREMLNPSIVAAGEQDFVTLKDGGWVIIVVENCQELLDSLIMAYRLAEDSEIQLPVNICYDGYYLSHLSDRVEIPTQEDVDVFLSPTQKYERPKVDPDKPLICVSFAPGTLMAEYRYKHCAAHERAKSKIDEIDGELFAHFGRSYGGQIEEYRTEDAEVILVTMGSRSGTAKVVVDRKRDEGLNIGLVKIRSLRPFPHERLIKALEGKKAIGVIDRSVCFGRNCGHLFVDVKASLADVAAPIAMVNFIDGLGGGDITIEHIERAVDITYQAARGEPHKKVTWLALE